MTRRILALIAIGLVGGFFSGLFGIGGGILMVPLFVFVLKLDQRHASALSLIAVLPAAVVGSITYGVAGHIDVLAATCIGLGGILGSIVGTRLLRTLPLGWLRWMFVALLLLVAIRMFIELPVGEHIAFSPWLAAALIGIGIIVGIASGLLGIGGGVLIVPALVSIFGFDSVVAKGTSLLAMIPMSITGTINNTRARLVKPLDGIIAGSAAAVASFPGSLLAHQLPAQLSNVLFALLVLFAASQLAWRAWKLRKKRD